MDYISDLVILVIDLEWASLNLLNTYTQTNSANPQIATKNRNLITQGHIISLEGAIVMSYGILILYIIIRTR